jgi:hypothetical protein
MSSFELPISKIRVELSYFNFSQPLAYLYNLILRSSSFPACWKIAKVCPVFKSGSKTDVSNYRPIALICNFAKIFERLLAKILCRHIAQYIVNEQHGFVKGKSTCTNLLEFTQYISNGLDNGEQIDVIYTDLSKAFDVVNHGLLLQKLSRFGLCNDIVSFFKSFLYNRYQFVAYNGYHSALYPASSGVTQGSNLGSILFNIFVNDVVLMVLYFYMQTI